MDGKWAGKKCELKKVAAAAETEATTTKTALTTCDDDDDFLLDAHRENSKLVRCLEIWKVSKFVFEFFLLLVLVPLVLVVFFFFIFLCFSIRFSLFVFEKLLRMFFLYRNMYIHNSVRIVRYTEDGVHTTVSPMSSGNNMCTKSPYIHTQHDSYSLFDFQQNFSYSLLHTKSIFLLFAYIYTIYIYVTYLYRIHRFSRADSSHRTENSCFTWMGEREYQKTRARERFYIETGKKRTSEREQSDYHRFSTNFHTVGALCPGLIF